MAYLIIDMEREYVDPEAAERLAEVANLVRPPSPRDLREALSAAANAAMSPAANVDTDYIRMWCGTQVEGGAA